MRRIHLCGLLILLGLMVAGNGRADVINSTGSGLTFPDNDAAGVASTINVLADETVNDLQVDLFNLSHTWVGDLIVRITSPSGTTSDLMYRVGNGNFGDGSNLSGNYSFADSGSNWATAVGSVGGNANVPNGVYQASTDGDGIVSLATAFSGETTQGTWTLFISDNAGFDNGSLGGWGVTISSSVTAMPEPGPGFLFVVAIGVVLRRRGKRAGPAAA